MADLATFAVIKMGKQNGIRNLGIKPSHQLWEAFLIRKINFLALVAFVNVTSAFFIFPLFNVIEFQPIWVVAMVLAPLVILINIRLGYIASSYLFFMIGVLVIGYLGIKLGPDSYSVLFFFPLTLSIVQLLGRKETFVHMIVNLGIYLVGMIFVGWCYYHGKYQIEFPVASLLNIKIFNIVVSALTSLAFITQITFENNKQEATIRQVLNEKDILMAEVFHRVKNNMNIVTSLLNLKKNNSDSEEVKLALEECRSRVFSMALVHQKIFGTSNVSGLNFGAYAKDLVEEIGNSVGVNGNDSIKVSADEIELPINYAIPCGLILNELVTNSYKHARVPGKPLCIEVELKIDAGQRIIIVKDNGPGAQQSDFEKPGSLGVDLLSSLCQQIDGTYSFENADGLKFEVRF